MRHAHLVLAPASISAARELIPFRVLLDDEAPGLSAGVDIDQDRTARSVRPASPARSRARRERTLQITFGTPGAEAYVFTFG